MAQRIKKSGQSLVERYALPPEEIEARSFALIQGMLPDLPWSAEERHIVTRIVHASGDPSLAPLVRFSPDAVAAGVAALQRGCAIYTDVTMVGAGLYRPWLQSLGCEVACVIQDPKVAAKAKEWGTTRAIASMRHLSPLLSGSIVAIGNAPTALLALLDQVDAGLPPPALTIGVPVGFVASAESKAALMERSLPHISLAGYRGGSPIAASILNALLFMATKAKGNE